MLTFRLGTVHDDEDFCCDVGGDEIKHGRFGDVGEAALLLRVCAIGVDVVLIGDAGLCNEAVGPRLGLLVIGREEASLEVDDETDAEAEATKFGLEDISGAPFAKKNLDDTGSTFGSVVVMDIELEGGLTLRLPSIVVPFA